MGYNTRNISDSSPFFDFFSLFLSYFLIFFFSFILSSYFLSIISFAGDRVKEPGLFYNSIGVRVDEE